MSEPLDDLADVIHAAVGVRLDRSRHQALHAALARAFPGIPHSAVLQRALDPVTGTGTLAKLVDEITIKETSFLRDGRQLASIDWHGLYARARAAGSPVVRVWSVACASGEEPYSLALLACEAFASNTPPVSILATDVSSAALAVAALGKYRERAVQAIDEQLRERYLVRSGDLFAVTPALRELVEIRPHNLMSDPYPPLGEAPFHLILCRNVLIYFDSETCARVVSGLERALAPGGRLVLGAADALCVLERAAVEFRLRPARSSARERTPRERSPRPGRTVQREPQAAKPPQDDPMNPEVHYLQGIDQLESGDPVAAVASLRRVLYLDPEFELAAFALGRAHEEAGEPVAARRRYQQALRMLDGRPVPGDRLDGAIDAAAVIGACEARLAVLTPSGTSTRAALTTKDGLV
jgi:chemotaxis protein methyltransferase CheR